MQNMEGDTSQDPSIFHSTTTRRPPRLHISHPFFAPQSPENIPKSLKASPVHLLLPNRFHGNLESESVSACTSDSGFYPEYDIRCPDWNMDLSSYAPTISPKEAKIMHTFSRMFLDIQYTSDNIEPLFAARLIIFHGDPFSTDQLRHLLFDDLLPVMWDHFHDPFQEAFWLHWERDILIPVLWRRKVGLLRAIMAPFDWYGRRKVGWYIEKCFDMVMEHLELLRELEEEKRLAEVD
jgi:hypothetical protein